MFVFTLNCVDIASQWTEQRAVWGKKEGFDNLNPFELQKRMKTKINRIIDIVNQEKLSTHPH